MFIYELTGSEADPVYQSLEVSNGNRQYAFLMSVVHAAIALNRLFLSSSVIKALNFQAIVCLHTNAGEYRPCAVTVGSHTPPEHFRVDALMEDFINHVNRIWDQADPVALAAFVLWRLNFIHPFINGNGRTARAACYFVLCLKAGSWLSGKTILPELIRQNREEYVDALQKADASLTAGELDLTVLHGFLSNLLSQQMATVPVSPEADQEVAEVSADIASPPISPPENPIAQ